jgi:hypothetical protein
MERSNRAGGPACAVCGACDQRVLATVLLAGGIEAVVCGSHELSFLRAARRPGSLRELRQTIGERRERADRRRQTTRDDIYGEDELAARLSEAFRRERRTGSDRRRG